MLVPQWTDASNCALAYRGQIWDRSWLGLGCSIGILAVNSETSSY